eukprot:CAMPEP_0181330440 /NCGR_PEP_ID=MMETSP1101-20121128/23901_1 /TAXON_ID=46948 /ORGANISM="Rhodomonas abbreviata, Strain Caron Lab Isolate" /LENGTH=194 /DNA_ID=CAMNT_0023439697 /DNA_START=112 /DNA_END=696 /DNA_ORIENTATION=+
MKGGGKTKCFLEILRKDEVMLISYKSPDQPPLPKEPEKQAKSPHIKFQALEMAGKPVFDSVTDTEGRFAFTAHSDGEHKFCWSIQGPNQATHGKDFRVHIDIKEGLPDEDYSNLAKQDHLSAMELKVRKLQDDIKRVKREQNYFKRREERFRKTSESTNFRAQWFSVFQIAGMIVVTALHLSYLRHYFIKKKLV